MKSFYIKNIWVLLLAVQVATVLYFIRHTTQYGIFNTDAFSYHLQWSKVAYTFNPFSEPVLADAGHDLIRVPFSMPHFILGFTAHIFNPLTAYLIWCCLGLLTTFFSLVLFARALGFNTTHAHVIALMHYTFFHVLSQLPPLSGNQLQYIVDSLVLKSESIAHFGPLQYPHDMFFYALLYTLLALTLFGIRKIKKAEVIKTNHVLMWGMLCLLLPFNYFYHWFQFAFALVFIVVDGFMLKWWKFKDVRNQYAFSGFVLCFVLVAWGAVILFQNSQLSDEEGYRFALMGGLAESRFFLLPIGLLIRIVLWSVAALIVLRIKPESVLLLGFLVGCVVLMNMQIVVGKNIQPGHWSFGIDRVYAWIAILITAVAIKKYIRVWIPKLVLPILTITVIFFALQTFMSWRHFERLSHWSKERAEVIEFLKTQPVSVVLAPELWIETDILIHTPHYSFLPRGAQSSVSMAEQLQRVSHAAFVLGYSKEGFLKWLHIRSVRFFGMLYATEKEFSSTYFYDPAKQEEVLAFASGMLPSWDWKEVENYHESSDLLHKKLDLIVLHSEESKPVAAGEIIFKNADYTVYRAMPLASKEWGAALPCPEKHYKAFKP
jgi:hypothetical protein